MIYVKSLFTGWREVNKEQALSYAKHIYKFSTGIADKDKIQYINDNLKGIVFKEEDLKDEVVVDEPTMSKPVKNDIVDRVENKNLRTLDDKETIQLLNKEIRELDKTKLIQMIGHHIMVSSFENENPIYYIKELKEIVDENYNKLKNIYEEDKQ